jgi:hypothetical protein
MLPSSDTDLYNTTTGVNDLGTAMDLDENSTMRVMDTPMLAVDAFTYEGWVRPAVTSSTTQHRGLLSKPNSIRLIVSNLTSGRPIITYQSTQAGDETAAGPSQLPTSVWTYLVGTYDGNQLRLYVDGTLAQMQASAPGPASSNMDATIGALYGGRIDELRISEVGRSESWIEFQRQSMLDQLVDFGVPEPF